MTTPLKVICIVIIVVLLFVAGEYFKHKSHYDSMIQGWFISVKHDVVTPNKVTIPSDEVIRNSSTTVSCSTGYTGVEDSHFYDMNLFGDGTVKYSGKRSGNAR